MKYFIATTADERRDKGGEMRRGVDRSRPRPSIVPVVKTLLEPPGTEWPRGRDEVRWGIAGGFLCLMGAQLFSIAWGVFTAGAVYGDTLPPADERPIWTLMLFTAGLWVAYFSAPLLAKRLTGTPTLKDFDVRANPAQIAVAAAVGVGTQLALLPVLYWVLLRFIDADPGRSAEALIDRVDGPADTIMLVLAVVVIAPFVEEWFYRGFMLPTLSRRFGAVVGAIGSSALFAVVHPDPITYPGIFVLALILSWMTMKTGRIGPAIAAHVAFNATTVVQLLAL